MARYIFVILTFICAACSKNELAPTFVDQNFYPVKEGNSWIYQVKETQYSVSQAPKETNYRIRESIGALVNDKLGIYEFNRERADLGNDNWTTFEILKIQSQTDKIALISTSKTETLLLFPLFNGSSWSESIGTINTLKESSEYYTLEEDEILVEQKNDSSAINLNRIFAVYSYEKGLSKRVIQNLQYCQDSNDCIGKGIISSGTEKTMTLLSFKVTF